MFCSVLARAGAVGKSRRGRSAAVARPQPYGEDRATGSPAQPYGRAGPSRCRIDRRTRSVRMAWVVAPSAPKPK